MKKLSILILMGVLLTGIFFCTLSGNEKSLTFVVFGDCHINDTTSSDSTILRKIIQKINKKNLEAQFAVNLGDIVDVGKNIRSYEKAIENYLRLIKNLKIPVYHVPGNHDLMNDKKIQEIYERKIGKLYYCVEKNGVLLVFLNSECLDETQIQWLKKTIAQPFRTKIVFVHRPVFPVYSGFSDIKILPVLKRIFKKEGVSGIFSGHEHMFYIERHNGILQVISGGAGGKLLPAPEGGKSIFHYCVVSVKNGQISVDVESVDVDKTK